MKPLLIFLLLTINLALAGPNVVFIAADDLRNDLGCYGHPEVKTPHLDRLAKRGITFDKAYCQQAVCNPSRASLLTGLRPDTLGIWNLSRHFREVVPEVVTLPELFKQHGYHTENIGKIFHNWRQATEGDPQSWSVPEVLHYARHDDDVPQSDSPLPPNLAKAPRCMKLDLPDEAYFDGRIGNLAVEALQERAAKPDEPFFLAVGFWKPHLPFNPPKKYWDLYDPNEISLPAHPDKPTNVPEIALHDGREIFRAAKDGKLTEAEIRELRQGYLAGITFLDAQVGKILDELDRQNLSDNTIIVFWSDHGFHLGENSLWAKTSNFELDARIPLIIAAPQSETKDQHSDALVELLDLYPTLAEMCGLPAPSDLEGKSLTPILENPGSSVKDGAFTQHPRPAYYKGDPEVMGVSVRTQNVRYTEWRNFATGEVEAQELYHHVQDPGETHNQIDSPPDAEELAIARKLLEAQFPRRPWVNGPRPATQ